MGRMTDASIRKLLLEARPLAVADGEGLTFTISNNLTASWIVRYRYAGRPREITLGRWPQLGLKEARLETSRVRLDIAAGKDPAYEKKVRKERKRGNFTIAELFEEYLEHRGPELSPVTVKNTRSLFEKDVLPRIGSRLARDLTPQEVVGLIRTVKERSHSVARRIWESLSTVMSYACASSVIDENPFRNLKPAAVLGKKPSVRKRLQLTPIELMSLCAELGEAGPVNRLAILILLATCVRKSELLEARWEEFDLRMGVWTVPAARRGNKARREYTIPLAPVVVGWLRELEPFRNESGYLLPRQVRNWRSSEQHMSRTTLNVVIKRLGGPMRDFCPHDLRSTARSYLRTLGCRDDVIERSLNHSLGGLTEIYQAGDLIEERREALGLWAELLGDAHLGRMLESRVLPPFIRKRWKEDFNPIDSQLKATIPAGDFFGRAAQFALEATSNDCS
jgi:integrase